MGENRTATVVSIFRERSLGGSEKVAQPTLKSFFDSLALNTEDNLVVMHYLAAVFHVDTDNHALSPNVRLKNFNANVKLYRQRLKDIDRRFYMMEGRAQCPDHIAGVALDVRRFTKAMMIDGASKILRDNIQAIAQNTTDFLDSDRPQQADYGMMSLPERFLVCDYIADTCDTLFEQSPSGGVGMKTLLSNYRNRLSILDKYQGIDYGDHDLGRYVTIKLNKIQEMKDGLARQISTVRPHSHRLQDNPIYPA